MERRILFLFSMILILLFFSNQTASGEKINFGLKYGFNISGHWSAKEKIEDDSVKLRFTDGILFGAMARFSISDFFKLQPELLYIQKGSIQEVTTPGSPIGTIKVNYDLQYIEIPLVLKLYFLKGKGSIQPTFSLGPYYAFLIKGAYTVSNIFIGSTKLDIDELKSSDMGVLFGSGVEFKKEKMEFSIQYRYSMGFVDLDLPTGPGAPTVAMRNYSYILTFEIVF